MGRILTSNQGGATSFSVWESQGYAEPPVWEYVALNVASPWRSVFGANDTVNLLETTQLGSMAGSRTRGWLRSSDEAHQTSLFINGYSSTVPGSSTYAPNTGNWGINGFTNTGTTQHWYSSVREYGWIDGNEAANAIRYSTPVVLPKRENHNFDLITQDGKVFIVPIGATFASHVNSTLTPKVDVTLLSGFQAANGQVNTNFGMGCYNARSGMYAVMFRTGTSGATYRLHLFPIGKKIRKDTTFKQLEAAFVASMSGYSYVDLTFNSVTNTNTFNDRYGHKVLLCDDNTLWVVIDDNNNTTSGNQGLRVYRATSDVTAASSITLDQYVQSAGNGSKYGAQTSPQYHSRYMFSYDNSVMAVYTAYYYYLSGSVGRFLPTDSVLNTDIGCRGFVYADTATAQSIAPTGGSEFAFTSGQNIDSANCYIWFLDPANCSLTETGTDTDYTRNARGAYPRPATSTWWGGHFANKIIQLDRFKP